MKETFYKRNRLGLAVTLISVSSLGLVACGGSSNDGDSGANTPTYSAVVQRTEFGIPHIVADDYRGLGYGLGYSFAEDNICSLASEIVTANGQRSLYFGDNDSNNRSDIFYTWYSDSAKQQELLSAQEPEVLDAIKGYAAGYSRYLRDTGVDNIDPTCAGEPWVQEIDELDLAAVYNKGNLRGGLSNFVTPIVLAAPPEPAVARLSVPEDYQFDFSTINVTKGGSNAYALGADVTENGRGMLYGNPHEPWQGVQRFYEFHLTIPGEIDVMGAGQQGQPFVNIGFNKDVAWSHTVSTAKRFTLYQLQLVDGDPLKYEYTNAEGVVEERDIVPNEVTIQVPGGETKTGTVYTSHFGPMLAINLVNGSLPPWGTVGNIAFAIRDAASENPRGINQWYSMNKATGVEDMEARLKETLGLPFINTIAADRFGKAMYADISTVPNVSATKFAQCNLSLGQPALLGLAQSGVAALDGSRATCEWDSDEDSPQAGILGGGNLPVLINETYSTNSNDSYWLSNPDEPLNGDFSPLLRRNLLPSENTVDAAYPRLLRTRMGIVQVQDRLNGTDGLGGNKFSLRKLQEVGYSNRSYAAELVLDDVLSDCFANPTLPVDGGGTIDGTAGCNALANWDRRNDVGSRGAHVFREFAQNADFQGMIASGGGFMEPFDENDPVNTPRDLIVNEATRTALGDAIKRFDDFGIALDEQLGVLQYEVDEGNNDERIPMHGGSGSEGVFNVLRTGINAEGEYTPATAGPTYMQTVTFDEDGPIAEALLAFSQSPDSTRPFHRDQTRRYSEENWIALPFSEAEVAAKAIGEPLMLSE